MMSLKRNWSPMLSWPNNNGPSEKTSADSYQMIRSVTSVLHLLRLLNSETLSMLSSQPLKLTRDYVRCTLQILRAAAVTAPSSRSGSLSPPSSKNVRHFRSNGKRNVSSAWERTLELILMTRHSLRANLNDSANSPSLQRISTTPVHNRELYSAMSFEEEET